MKNFIIGALIIGVSVIVGCAVLPATIVNYGASAGPEHTNLEYFHGGLVFGGNDTTLSDNATSVTITAKEICEGNILSWAVSGGNDTGTTTLPTSASLASDCLSKDGDAKTVLFRNTAASTNTVIVAGTGMTLLKPDGQNVVIGGVSSALLHFFRASSTEIIVNVDELVDAD